MCLTQIKPLAPKFNALIKLHKDNEPIRPVVNNIHAPTYKLAKFLKQWLSETLQLPNNYMVHNSVQLANDLHNIKLEETYKLITFDIKDLHVNITIKEVIITTETLLRNKKLDNSLIQQKSYCYVPYCLKIIANLMTIFINQVKLSQWVRLFLVLLPKSSYGSMRTA